MATVYLPLGSIEEWRSVWSGGTSRIASGWSGWSGGTSRIGSGGSGSTKSYGLSLFL